MTAPDVLKFGAVEIDAGTRRVRKDSRLIHLTPIEFDLLPDGVVGRHLAAQQRADRGTPRGRRVAGAPGGCGSAESLGRRAGASAAAPGHRNRPVSRCRGCRRRGLPRRSRGASPGAQQRSCGCPRLVHALIDHIAGVQQSGGESICIDRVTRLQFLHQLTADSASRVPARCVSR